ncbi:hypothetical protein PIB30_076214 [Stylosanthes scabra]|uniref:Uncharacterized protein n=1 Tax=Stylosanthes scabra TaxID=79078 RepID=A0ABU6QPT8_9FABA|nr:hypothetical protein [Stylosanthes scabra]
MGFSHRTTVEYLSIFGMCLNYWMKILSFLTIHLVIDDEELKGKFTPVKNPDVEGNLDANDFDESVSTIDAKTPVKRASTPLTIESPILTQPEDDSQTSTNRFKRNRLKKQKFQLLEDNNYIEDDMHI